MIHFLKFLDFFEFGSNLRGESRYCICNVRSSGVSILGYAVCSNNLKIAKYFLDEISKNFGDNTQERARRVESRISKDGYLDVGIPGLCTTLIGAMTLASPEMC